MQQIKGRYMVGIGQDHKKKSGYEDNDLVCHCFEYTRRDIEKDYIDNGRSLIIERIIYEKKSGKCNCAEINPKGR